ncbi:hypothetical protein BU24DRAFT_423184 [Aaosphaeria arxii CBS 175.79]|uniref:Rhodopsin domain-containing protein n=1 Tax=Aaosphaeria arxii CBS 175.79 TaxID=1450172 RepID=A0A6A5XLJ3_9PLEO|nr:uncharacterized protein BU24DRAFT_423184 [Aaosphaeria arxii CBS 175.79]KAF2014148.1 hypothetical protein BU24DRAFT_423184 [Aaosphaeria arxii CBS 175.79]
MAEQVLSSNRFAPITPYDHSGLIYITAILTFIYTSITFLTRCYIKFHMFGIDDWAMTIAQAFNLVQFVLLIVSLSAGLGKSFDLISTSDYLHTATTLYSNQIIFYLSLGASKLATLLLVQRLSARDAKRFWATCNVVAAALAAWTLLAVIMVSAGCSPKEILPHVGDHTCTGIIPRYQVVVATDALFDVVLVALVAYLVWQLHMSVQLKVQVVFVFGIRLPVIPLAILALLRFQHSLQSPNPGVDRSSAIVYQQSQLCYSLIAGTIPCLKSFIRSFDTGSGGMVTNYSSQPYGSNGYAHGESYKMQSFGTGQGSATRSRNEDKGDVKISTKPFKKEGHVRLRADSPDHVTAITHPISGQKREADRASHGSQEMIIRRDVQWEVHSENLR